jgi:hypothetical protein
LIDRPFEARHWSAQHSGSNRSFPRDRYRNRDRYRRRTEANLNLEVLRAIMNSNGDTDCDFDSDPDSDGSWRLSANSRSPEWPGVRLEQRQTRIQSALIPLPPRGRPASESPVLGAGDDLFLQFNG